MRLEIDSAPSIPFITENVIDDQVAARSAEANCALSQGIKAAQEGNRAKARTYLLKAAELNPRSESAWLWLASISEYPEELLGFLNNVLDINSENERARDWKGATHALLAKTFVQRGIDASQDNEPQFAVECFQKALEYDPRNSAAWIWLASLDRSYEAKVTMLERALEIDPENEEARGALVAAKQNILKARLADAKTAAISGNNPEAIKILDDLLQVNPDSIDAWTMRSHLAEGFDEKIRCFESILAIEPDNVAAQAGRDSLLSLFGTAHAAQFVNDEESCVAEQPAVETAPDEADAAGPADDEGFADDLTVAFDVSDAFTPPIGTPATSEENENEMYESREEPAVSFPQETTYSPEPGNEPDYLEEAAPQMDPAPSYDQSEREVPIPEVEFETVAEIDAPQEQMLNNVAPADAPQEPMLDPEAVVACDPEGTHCPFCGNVNEPQAICCGSCMAVLTLSDLELLLANQAADKLTLRRAVEEMERMRLARDLDADELVTLALGHLNLRNLQLGYACLADASMLSPNNVVLAAQVNSLLIRLEEIKLQDEARLKMPKGKSILVVDDSPTVRKLIAGKLEKCGHDVICASDGVEAVERLDHFIPDLVLLDITMPRMDGYQVCKQIRGNNATKDVPVVMISGKDGFFDKVRGRMAGTTGYITKPFGPETLMKAVEMYLSGEIPEFEFETDAEEV